jgi:nicotinate-nucleotide adenylyltransferase
MIGVLGGTFDPIHYGHLRPAREVYRRLNLDVLRLVPAATPPHRGAPIASAQQRLRMVELAVPEFPGFIADDREIRRGGISYTVPTLESLRAEIGAAPLCLLIGSDGFAGLPTWHRWERLFELAHIVVMQRPGSPLPALLPAWAAARACRTPQEVAGRPAGGILIVPVTLQDVSATGLRAAIARGETPSPDALPRAVWEYIRRLGLYRSAA